ncbi:MAG: Uma2 family endonuclease [Candidatus Accumulibacter sp.]|uniref:Uma2 family endonuclease n=1 Tax=Candidatus Accumulibacter cognatus TaxID=2954383 RepID=A0A7D5SUC1_9PROT|nr:Uma2 family endonuclease [Accumulibacter sp.]MCM8621321.1 Uma2 family endonuclease [Accumulibacter sp.]QLH51603.1 MAG: Uma2 family endonuclease [Candidatus Accumulibacter cognatus]
MVKTAAPPSFTFGHYLEWENRQPMRHEFIRGEVFAMTGASDLHNELSGNLYTLLRQHLRGTECRVFMADVKLRVEAADCGFYPDLLVTCAESDRADRHVKRSPVVVVEVLSASTAAFDIGEKFAAYRQLVSLREYVLVDQERIRIQVYRRLNEQWFVDSVGPGEQLRLESVGLKCPVERVYEDLSRAAPGARS